MRSHSHHGFKNYLITYPHCDLSNMDIMQRLRTIEEQKLKPVKIHYMIVSKEFHQDGEEHHHVFLSLSEPLYLGKKKMDIFDLVADNRPLLENGSMGVYHPNIERCPSPKGSIKYVKKQGEYSTSGICPFKEELTQKEKNELLQQKSLSELVDAGLLSLYQVPTIKRALDIIRMEKQSQLPAQKPLVHWFFGATGTGKSKLANDQSKEKYGDDVWRCMFNDQWYDGYIGQQGAIFDDVRPGTFKFDTLLKLLDQYKLVVPIKGGFTRWAPKEIWITAPAEPRQLYRNYQTQEPYEGIEQLERRIEDCREFQRRGSTYWNTKHDFEVTEDSEE